MTDHDYLKYAKMIDAGKLPVKTTAISALAWADAQKIVALTLGASNETYINPTLLYGLCEHIAEALDNRTK